MNKKDLFCRKNMSVAVIYQALVNIAGLFIIIQSMMTLDKDHLWIYLIWTLFSTISELKPIMMPTKEMLTVSFALHISALVLFGAPTAILLAAVSNTIVDALGRRGLNRIVFNISQYAISIYIAWQVYELTSKYISFSGDKGHFIAIFISSVSYVVVNSLLVITIVSLSKKVPFLKILLFDARVELLHFASLVPIIYLVIILYRVEPYAIVFVMLPLATAHFSFKNYINLWTETKTTIETLANIIDRRDAYTAEHSIRVSNLCAEIADKMNLHPAQAETLVSAAMVHDLGKISIPDNILLKDGVLTAEERERMCSHTTVGYNILKNLSLYSGGAKLVLNHHERYDGHGYPYRLKNKDIPVGARILAVADSFDAMTSDRPYKKAMSSQEAINEMNRCSGSQFDPEVVEALVKVLKKEQDPERG